MRTNDSRRLTAALGRSLRAARLEAGLRQVDLGRLSRTCSHTISRLESGKIEPGLYRLYLLYRALGPEFLLRALRRHQTNPE